MIDYNRYSLSFDEAKSIIDHYDNMSDAEFITQISRWASFDVPENDYAEIYKSIRKNVVSEFRNALLESENKVTYDLDLRVGITLYESLNQNNGFDLVAANNDDIWRYISVKVMPDITFLRYPNLSSDVEIIQLFIPNYNVRIDTEKDSVRIKKKRFYSHTRRIWLKTLWWYVYLGWQGSPEETYKVLKNNGTNIIGHFIERPGRGYREKLFRCMLYAFSILPEQKDKTFRAAAKLNLAKCVSVEPSLSEGGEPEYAKKLFDEVYLEGMKSHGVDTGNTE